MAMSRSFGGTPLTTRSSILISPSVTLSRPAIDGEQGRLTAARRSDEHHEFARLHFKVDTFQHRVRSQNFFGGVESSVRP